jgi:hypothetical protein
VFVVALAPALTGTPAAADGPSALPTPGSTVMIVGDSVPMLLAPTLDARLRAVLGWRLVSAAEGACSVFGERMAYPDGSPKERQRHCGGVVAHQRAVLAEADPEVVIVWDRLSNMPFFTVEDEFVLSGTPRFWEIRARSLRAAVTRLSAGGASVVLVAAEPIGIGVDARCPDWSDPQCGSWLRFRIDHYADVTRRWNEMLASYAAEHPAEVSFVSITDAVCRVDVAPCDDRLDSGEVARTLGTHYEGRGATMAARLLVSRMVDALAGMPTTAMECHRRC